MDHSNYKNYTLQELYDALETVDDVEYPGQLSAIEAKIDEIEENSGNKLKGLGGWLILVAFGVIITPVKILLSLLSIYPVIFASGAWKTLTTEGSEIYSPFWAPFIISEIFINCVFLVVCLYMGYRFFMQKSDFPKWFIGITISALAFVLIENFSANYFQSDNSAFSQVSIMELVRSIGVVAIWVPYMLRSKRVKATFVN